MTGKIYKACDGLFKLRRDFLSHEDGGVSMSGDDVRLLNVLLFDLGIAAMAQAHELSRYRGLAARQKDHALDEVLLDELSRPGTNLVLLEHPAWRREKA